MTLLEYTFLCFLVALLRNLLVFFPGICTSVINKIPTCLLEFFRKFSLDFFQRFFKRFLQGFLQKFLQELHEQVLQRLFQQVLQEYLKEDSDDSYRKSFKDFFSSTFEDFFRNSSNDSFRFSKLFLQEFLQVLQKICIKSFRKPFTFFFSDKPPWFQELLHEFLLEGFVKKLFQVFLMKLFKDVCRKAAKNSSKKFNWNLPL